MYIVKRVIKSAIKISGLKEVALGQTGVVDMATGVEAGRIQAGMSRDELISVWLGCSGLIEKIPKIIPIEQQNKWKQLYASQSYHKEIYPI